MFRSENLLLDGERALEADLGVGMPSGREQHDADIVVGARGRDLIHAGPLLDRERALEQRLGLGIAAHHLVEIGKLADRIGRVRMVRAVRLLVDADDMLADLLGVRELALRLVDHAEIVEHEHEFARVRPLELLLDAGGPAHIVFRLGIVTLPQLGVADIVQRVGDLGTSGAVHALADRQHALVGLHRLRILAHPGERVADEFQHQRIVRVVGAAELAHRLFELLGLDQSRAVIAVGIGPLVALVGRLDIDALGEGGRGRSNGRRHGERQTDGLHVARLIPGCRCAGSSAYNSGGRRATEI